MILNINLIKYHHCGMAYHNIHNYVILHCTAYSVRCTVYVVHCTLHTARRTMYVVHCIQCTTYMSYTVRRVLYVVHCKSYIVYNVRHCTSCTVRRTLYDVQCKTVPLIQPLRNWRKEFNTGSKKVA